jgi:hypothetical protein
MGLGAPRRRLATQCGNFHSTSSVAKAGFTIGKRDSIRDLALKGHDLSRAANAPNWACALQGAEKPIQLDNFEGFVTGPDFSRADKAN